MEVGVNMMLLNERRCSVLLDILENEGWARIRDLAQKFHVSDRTIRYDLDVVDDFLQFNNLSSLIRKQNGGVKFVESVEEKTKLLRLFQHLGLYQYVLSSNERLQKILAELLYVKDYIRINDLAAILYVSRGTVIKDLQKVREWLERRHLELRSIPKYGIKVVGPEREFRQAVVELLRKNLSLSYMLEWITTSEPNLSDSQLFKCWLENIDVAFLQTYIRRLENELKVVFSDVAFSGLVIYLIVSIYRIRAGRDIVGRQSELEVLQSSRTFAIALTTIPLLEERFDLSIPLDEVSLFTEYILGSNVASSAVEEQDSRTEIQMLACNLIARVSQDVPYDLTEDHQLLEGLLEEVRPTLFRVKYGLSLENPYLDEVKSNYPLLFESVRKHTNSLAAYIGGQLLDEEISYLTVHFSAALERMKNRDKTQPSVLVICAAGTGTANLLSSRLQSLFDIKIVAVAPCRQVQMLLEIHHVDIIVSTVPIPPVSIPILIVNPLLPPHDIALLENHMDKAKGTSSVDDLVKVIEKYCSIQDYPQLRRELDSVLNATLEETRINSDPPSLYQLLPASNIRLNVPVQNWRDAIYEAGNVLYQEGYIEQIYGQAMVDVVDKMGPYIVFWKGIALPHADIDCGVKKSGFSFIRLKEPVVFGTPENDPVDMIFALAAVDHSSHVIALLELTNILSDAEKVACLRSESEIEKITQMFLSWSRGCLQASGMVNGE